MNTFECTTNSNVNKCPQNNKTKLKDLYILFFIHLCSCTDSTLIVSIYVSIRISECIFKYS